MTHYRIEGNKVYLRLQINGEYNLEDIKLAYNDVSDKCVAFISLDKKDNIFVVLEVEKDPKSLLKEFMYRLSEQQTRSILLKNNSKIRDLIVEQAFKPIHNLKDRIDA